MRVFALLLVILLSAPVRAQLPASFGSDSLFRRSLTGLPQVQRFEKINRYASFLSEKSRFALARVWIEQGLADANQTTNQAWEASFWHQLGHLEMTAGNQPKSLQHLLKALEISRNTHDYDRQVRTLYLIQAAQGDPATGPYAAQLLAITNRFPTPHNRNMIYTKKVYWYQQSGQLDSALVDCRKAMLPLAVRRDWISYYALSDMYGNLLSDAGRYREAEAVFRRALAYGIRQQSNRRVLYEYENLTFPLLHQGRLAEAERYAKLALAATELDPERRANHRTKIYDALTQIAEAGGNFRQALAYQRLHKLYSDSVTTLQRSRDVAELETRYRTAEQQVRINGLADDNQQRVRQVGWLAGGLLAMVLLLGLVLWQYRTIRQTNNRLLTTNQTIAENSRQMGEQSEKLTVLMRELNHRVKNNLAIVSSLLRLQSKRLNDEGAMRAVQDGQHRVEALSLIHQRLYQTDSVNQVAIRSYVADLTEGLLLSYGFDPAHFDCRLEVADIELDMDVAVPLGLILNEVLTNAFKYAYTPTDPQTNKPPRRPFLLVRLQPEPGNHPAGLVLEVQDNGPGVDWSGNGSLPKRSRNRSFGQRLITALTEQLGGQMELTNRNGAYFRLSIPLTEVHPPVA